MFPVCYGGYLRLNEDKTSFNKPGWKPVDNSTNKDELFRLCPKPWRYQGAEDTDTVGTVLILSWWRFRGRLRLLKLDRLYRYRNTTKQ